jgi:ribosomal protein S13
MTPAECAMVGSGLWMIAACLFGDDLAVSQASHAAAKATHALLREKALLPAVSASTNAIPDDLRDAVEEHIRRNDPLGILGRRRLSRRPTRVRGRRTRAERRKR